METLLNLLNSQEVLAALAAIGVGVLTTLLIVLRSHVKNTKNKLDDSLMDALDKAYEKSKEEKKSE